MLASATSLTVHFRNERMLMHKTYGHSGAKRRSRTNHTGLDIHHHSVHRRGYSACLPQGFRISAALTHAAAHQTVYIYKMHSHFGRECETWPWQRQPPIFAMRSASFFSSSAILFSFSSSFFFIAPAPPTPRCLLSRSYCLPRVTSPRMVL